MTIGTPPERVVYDGGGNSSWGMTTTMTFVSPFTGSKTNLKLFHGSFREKATILFRPWIFRRSVIIVCFASQFCELWSTLISKLTNLWVVAPQKRGDFVVPHPGSLEIGINLWASWHEIEEMEKIDRKKVGTQSKGGRSAVTITESLSHEPNRNGPSCSFLGDRALKFSL